MTKPKGVSLDELAAIQKKENKNTDRFTAEDERRHALCILYNISELSQGERARVLRRALKTNEA